MSHPSLFSLTFCLLDCCRRPKSVSQTPHRPSRQLGPHLATAPPTRMRDAPPTPPGAAATAPAASSSGPCMSMYAHIATLEQPVPRDMTEYWMEPSSYFLIKGGWMGGVRVGGWGVLGVQGGGGQCYEHKAGGNAGHSTGKELVLTPLAPPPSPPHLPGTLLKEAIDDLEWPNAPVVLELQRDPQKLTMRSSGVAGALEVRFFGGGVACGPRCGACAAAGDVFGGRGEGKEQKASMQNQPTNRPTNRPTDRHPNRRAPGLLRRLRQRLLHLQLQEPQGGA